MITAVYTRVSTLDQAETGYSLSAQKRVLTEWAMSHGYNSIIYYCDEGISGKDISHRPAMQQVIADAKVKKFDAIIVWSLSRLTRSVSDLYYTWEILCDKGIELFSYTESFDTSTPIGRAMMGLLGVFAQMEREITAERVKAAIEERAIQGKRTCGCVLGYDFDGPDSIKINKQEAQSVSQIYDMYLKYKSLPEVSRQCAAMGHKGKFGRTFKPEHIKVILTRPIYKGFYTYKGKQYQGRFTPIVCQEKWDAVQLLLRKNGYKSKNQKTERIAN